ncbi:hypothetical protein [Marinobacter persicus]|uniref:hypothetical protein n=1 Tax=Marinobacter persicus TaxID=930118 RepID=UPI000CEAD8A8|nr:hypothetical protein [Marinobacter persicus]
MIDLTAGTSITVLLLVTGLLATAAVRAWANHRNLLVIPSDRCSHEIPTPHGGGIAIAILIITLGILALAFSWLPDQASAWAFIGLGAAILSRKLGGHLPVTLGYGAIIIVCLMPLSWLASINPDLGVGLFITTFTIACVIAYKLGCGRPEVA